MFLEKKYSPYRIVKRMKQIKRKEFETNLSFVKEKLTNEILEGCFDYVKLKKKLNKNDEKTLSS